MESMESVDVGPYKIAIGAMAAVIVFLSGLCAKLAKMAWDERNSRLIDRNDTIAQLNVAKRAVIEKKGGSP